MSVAKPDTERRLAPTPHDLVDLSFGAVLAGLGVIGFGSTFGGGEELTVGLPAVVAGAGIGYVLAKLRLQLLVAALLSVVAFFLLGGALALRKDAIAGVLPSLDVIEGLVDGTVNGWAKLLTMVPPAGQAGDLLAVPYFAGFAGGLLAVGLGISVPRWPVCVVPPSVVLGVSILLGVRDPASPLLQGAVFGAFTVAWISLRVRRVSPALVAGGRRRVASGIAMLGLAGVSAFAVGPILPGADTDRFLLRERIEPPFDPSQFPSALARFRRYHGADPDEIEGTLFTVQGLPEGASVRFAVMDDYDDYVWRASPPNQPIGGNYLRVGEQIPGAAEGGEVTLRFEMGELEDVDSIWIPTAGSPSSIIFQGSRSETLNEEFRFNRDTETAASKVVPEAGDQWTVVAAFPEVPDADELRELQAGSVSMPELNSAGDDVVSRIIDIVREVAPDATSPYEQVNAIAEYLRDRGGYTDGVEYPWPAGHGLVRMVDFWTGPQPIGNGEQFAAALAYAARALNIPSRVVLEFRPEASGDGPVEVQADDAVAVVEVLLSGVGWVPVEEPTPDEDDVPDQQAPPRPEEDPLQVQPPPPTTIPPRPPLPAEREQPAEEDDVNAESGESGILGLILKILAVAAVPLVVLGGPALVVVWLKRRRRQRRRRSGEPDVRIAAGWAEVVDLARDTGAAVPPKATRLEIARFFPAVSAIDLAGATDVHVFGRSDPTDADAEAVWRSVDAVRGDLLRPLSRRDRIRAAVTLTSLRVGR